MPIEQIPGGGGTVITGANSIEFARMLSLKGRLRLEAAGIRFRGINTYAYVKKQYNLTGNRAEVTRKFEALFKERYPDADSAQ
jgi:hypothetical protein